MALRPGAERQTFRYAHGKDLSVDDVMTMRHFLTRSGWAGGAAPEPAATAAPDLIFIIDHAEARVFRTALGGATPHELLHLLHDIDRTQHDADREERYPTDNRFFDAVAAAVSGDGRSVVIGHGKGQSNEADHLMAHLAPHDGAAATVAGLPRIAARAGIRRPAAGLIHGSNVPGVRVHHSITHRNPKGAP